MTKSTITREQLEEWVAQFEEDGGCDATDRQLEALIRQSLAAMDSEPVAYMRDGEDGTEYNGHNEFSGGGKGIPLYRHAQPAPVVPEEKPIPNTLSMYAVDAVAAIAEVKGWNACRAAMLAADPQSPGSEPATVPGKWIPVSDRMPEDRTQVILWDAEIGEVTSGHYSHKTHTFYHCGDAIENEITHWMAPPAAPQEVKDAHH
ncbi:TPA: DUF551 domain-containing protein [Klebsiella pneumoniae]|nr:DUF551 domain-containing protein [Klebsiella pneumoniae]HDY8764224.1 DUF551 domain-containing protein [Klebsiella pneumoniae]